MSDQTLGLQLPFLSRATRNAVELLSSMRFAISLLALICIASVIGTVLKQHEPFVNYVNQFGLFWATLFTALHLHTVYSSWWFLLILAFLVLSTSLCIARNAPKILVDLKTYKENIRATAFRAFHHKAQATLAMGNEAAARHLGALLVSKGWRVKLQQRDNSGGAGSGWMLAAKTGSANKLGYIAAHSAIVLVCVGGLLDGDLIVRAQMWFGGKVPYAGGGLIAAVPDKHRLSLSNPTFRGNLLVSEGAQSSTAILNQSDGVLLQDLPFSIELKKFVVDYYSTGMPKLFASDIVIHDKATGEKTSARVEVNHPVTYDGVAIYQSSFDDGGSRLKLKAWPMVEHAQSFDVEGNVGSSSSIVVPSASLSPDQPGQTLTLEYAALRTINVENFGRPGEGSGADVRSVNLQTSIESHLGAAHKTATQKELRNVGPSVTYKLRDAAGQAQEFHNYMLPVDTGDGAAIFLLGVRSTAAEPFKYLRVPADDRYTLQGFMDLRKALLTPADRQQAVERYVRQAVGTTRPDLQTPVMTSALQALSMFAQGQDQAGRSVGGLQALSDYIEAKIPEAERAQASTVLVRILSGVLFELAQITRERAGLPALEANEATQAFMSQAVLSLSDAQLYPAPLVFQLQDFSQVQASVFQVARAPGRNIVYLGCFFLIVGVFAMLYVRERRLWVWLTPSEAGGSQATMALSSNRQTMDVDREFQQLAFELLGAQPEHKGAT